jgi:alpha-galactosidase
MKRLIIALAFAAAVQAYAAPATLSVDTPSVGKVTLECKDAGSWKMDMRSCGEGGCDVVTVTLAAPAEAVPQPFTVKFAFSGADVHHVWTTDYQRHTFTLWPSLWAGQNRYTSQLAAEAPLLAALNSNDEAKFTMAASDAFNKVIMSLSVHERTCVINGSFSFFSEPAAPTKEYSVSVRLDRRTRYWADAVRDAGDWIGKTAGFTPAYVPESAYDPLYSSWYAYLQDVHDHSIEKEARLAAELGMKTMILDDGWQKEESKTFYSAVGDWMPVASRFPDMKAHVDAVHKAGLKYMLWLSVPYIGEETEIWKRFKDKTLWISGKPGNGQLAVLDPRYPEVREYLARTYERVVGEWGFDGVKLDFIDQFVKPANDPAAKNGYQGCDVKSVPEAVDILMKDVLKRLRKINPDVLIEFRQRYMGPAIRQYGNMIRAADCPADFTFNRRRICDLRLTSGLTAVHSDMLVWSADETPEGAAKQILSSLFGVIQYSMVLQTIPESQRAVIRHWLDFSQRHRKTLLKSAFRPHFPQFGYPFIEAESEDELICGVYATGWTVKIGASGKDIYVINATDSDTLVLELAAAPKSAEAFDVVGGSAGRLAVSAGLQRVKVPRSGYLKLTY